VGVVVDVVGVLDGKAQVVLFPNWFGEFVRSERRISRMWYLVSSGGSEVPLLL